MTYSDEMLRVYLDGDLSAEDATRLEAVLATDRDLERRLMALDAFAAPVRNALSTLPGEARIERLRQQIPQVEAASAKARPAYLRACCALAAALVLGIALGTQMMSGGTAVAADWRMEVARYQALYVPETIAYAETAAEALDAQLTRASAAVGLDLELEALAQLDGLDLRRAQVLGFAGAPLIQLAYSDEAGAPFALCIMPGEADKTGPEALAGLSTYTWESGSHRFILVGGAEQAKITNIAMRFQQDAMERL